MMKAVQLIKFSDNMFGVIDIATRRNAVYADLTFDTVESAEDFCRRNNFKLVSGFWKP